MLASSSVHRHSSQFEFKQFILFLLTIVLICVILRLQYRSLDMAATLFTSESPAGKILAYLQRHGEATVKQLEELLGISTTAVREHLTHLEAKDLVTAKLVRRGPGRPHALYFLTATAQDLFPKEYDTLST